MTTATTTRFLTEAEKDGEIASFEAYKLLPGIWRRDHPDDHGGSGRVDHEVLPLVDALNALEGVCTVQSCCGHRWPVGDEHNSEYVHNGQLWLRLGEDVACAFDTNVGDLLKHEVIVHVQKLYAYQTMTEPHEVFDVQWKDGCMDEAQGVIVEFFEGLCG